MNSIKLAAILLLCTAATLCCAQTAAPAAVSTHAVDKISNWYARVGIGGVIYHPAASVYAAGSPVPGATAGVSNNVTVLFDVGYYVRPQLTVSLMAGIPPKPKLSGEGSIAPYGELASVWYGPAVLSAQYRFGHGKLQPYVGPGVAYAIILRKHAATLTHPQVHNAFAPVIQAGADYMFTKHWGAYIDCKQIWLSVDARGSIQNVVPATAHVKLYPTVTQAGFKYRF